MNLQDWWPTRPDGGRNSRACTARQPDRPLVPGGVHRGEDAVDGRLAAPKRTLSPKTSPSRPPGPPRRYREVEGQAVAATVASWGSRRDAIWETPSLPIVTP